MNKFQLGLLLFFLIIISIDLQAQISGRITGSDDNEPLIGATVTVKGTTTATITDWDGNFSIKVEIGQTLVFSYVGFKTKEVTITDNNPLTLILQSDVTSIEQVIVAGVAANVPKRKVSISVEKVTSKDLESVPGTSAASALQGKIAGITIVSGQGNPGSSNGIRLRGSTSVIGDSKPLIIVDGVMLEGEFSDINVDDIASFDVVKGAASTALYGSRAGNGVIVVTTKRGSSTDDKIDIRVRNEFGIQSLAKKMDLSEHHPYFTVSKIEGDQFTRYQGVNYPSNYKGGLDYRIVGTRKTDYDHYSDNLYSNIIDHQEEMFQRGSFYTNYLSIGSNISKTKTKYFISAENNNNSGIVIQTKGYQRQNFRLNLDQTLWEKLKIKSSTLYTRSSIDDAGGGGSSPGTPAGGESSAFNGLLLVSPDVNLNLDQPYPDTLALKKYFYRPDHWSAGENPLHTLYYEESTTQKWSILQNFNLEYPVFQWLVLNGDYSIEKYVNQSSNFKPVGFQNYNLRYIKGNLTQLDQDGISTNLQLTANINKSFGQLVTRGKISFQEEGFIGHLDYYNSADTGITIKGIDPDILYRTNHRLYEIFSRNYYAILDADYLDRYIASLLIRYDGSSLFGANSRWNPYYRVSFGYRINEDLKLPNVQEIKLRTSIGTSGQRPRYDYQYESYKIIAKVLKPVYLGNKDLKPAQTHEWEIGIESNFFNRITLDMTYAINSTTGAYAEVPLDGTLGFTSQFRNVVDIESYTFEAVLGLDIVNSENFNFNQRFAFDKGKQQVVGLKAPAFNVGPTYNGAPANFRVAEGEVYGIMYGRSWVYSLDQMAQQLEVGRTIDEFTVNSDGYVIEKGTEGTYLEKPIELKEKVGDKFVAKEIAIANMLPDFNLAYTSSISWKNWNFNMLWHWKHGGDIYNLTKQKLYLENRHGDQDMYGRPEVEKKSVEYYQTLYNSGIINSHFVEDGTYLKLREVSLYYNFKLADKNMFIKNIKAGLLTRNIYTFTRYSGWDPEVATGNDLSNYIIDYFNYPNFRTISGSLEFKF